MGENRVRSCSNTWRRTRKTEARGLYCKKKDLTLYLRRELLPGESLLWGSDYPHTEETFSHSQEQIEKDFVGIPEAEVYNIVAGNAIRLYGLNL